MALVRASGRQVADGQPWSSQPMPISASLAAQAMPRPSAESGRVPWAVRAGVGCKRGQAGHKPGGGRPET